MNYFIFDIRNLRIVLEITLCKFIINIRQLPLNRLQKNNAIVLDAFLTVQLYRDV